MFPANLKLAGDLERYASLLQLTGADRFRVRAYSRAARTVARADVDIVAETRRNGVPQGLPGIGPRIAALIHRYADEGELPGLEELEREFPTSMLELLRVPRLNVKRVGILRDQLGVRSLDDLRRAAEEHRLAGVKGLGSRVEAEVLAALGRHSKNMPHRRADVLPIAARFTDLLAALPGVRRVLPVGALRRRQEVVFSLDFLLIVDAGVTPGDLAVPLREWAAVEEQSDGRLRMDAEQGLPLQIALSEQRHAGEALLRWTGAEAHVEEWERLRTGRKLRGGADEKALYRSVGLVYVEPELREGRGEMEAAKAGTLPRLIRLEDLRGDLHSHTNRTDGRNTLREMAEAAQTRGLSYLAVTDHTQSLRLTNGQDPARIREQMEEIDRLNGMLSLRLLKGAEVDILEDGSLDLPDDVLRDLDLTVCSIHSKFTLPPQRQTERVLRAMEHPSFRILGHPTGRLLLRRQGHPLDLDRIIAAAASLGRVLELNAQPDRLDLDDLACRRAKEAGVRLAISSDAHGIGELDFLSWGVDQARRGWIEPGDVINTLPLPQFLDYLRRRT